MDPNSPDTNVDSSEESRSQEIQNLKTYLQQRFRGLPVLPGDPRSIPGTFDLRNNVSSRDCISGGGQAPRSSENFRYSQDEAAKKADDRETVNAVSALTREVGLNLGNDNFRLPKGKDDPESPTCSKRGRGSVKAVRFTYSPDQVEALVTAFNINPYPTRLDRENLECMLGLSAERIKNWFQNRRSKERRKAKQNNTPLPPPLLMRDVGQTPHVSYPTHPHMLQFVKPRLSTSTQDHAPAFFHHYLRNRLPIPNMMPSEETPPLQHPPRSVGDAQLTTYRPGWSVPWPPYAYHVARTTASSVPLQPPTYGVTSGWQSAATPWPPYFDNRCVTYKPHTATSENSHSTDTFWAPALPSLTAHHPNYPPSASQTSRASNIASGDFEDCLAPTRPHSQLTWYDDAERPVDASSVDDVGEESLHLEDSASVYSVGDTSQSDTSSYRSLLDDSANVDASSVRQVTNQGNFVAMSSQPVVPTVSTGNGPFVNYSPVSPPLAQDLDAGCPSVLQGYQVFSYSSTPSTSLLAKDLQSDNIALIDAQKPLESDSSELEDEEVDDNT